MPEKIKWYVQSLRLERWPRSLAVIPGIVAAFVLNGRPYPEYVPSWPGLALQILAAFWLTFFISTANYIVNEITDAPYDAHHPDKKNRPLVQRKIKRRFLALLWLILTCAALLIAHACFNHYFLFSLLALLIAGIVYNVPPVRVKDIPYLDSTLESANNPIRFLIGWHVLSDVFPPLYLLVSWWAFGNFLMIGKRVAEKKFLSETQSAAYRISLKKYKLKHLQLFMAVNGIVFLLTFIKFSVNAKIKSFLFILPFIIIYLMIFMKKATEDPVVSEEPEKLLKNRFFAYYTFVLALLFIIAYIFR
jgi:4-hydroxybenzoate polyprenyltransferase